MQVLLPGFAGPSRIYELREHRNGELTVKRTKTLPDATLKEVAEELDKERTVLTDSANPQVIDELKERGFHVIAGRL